MSQLALTQLYRKDLPNAWPLRPEPIFGLYDLELEQWVSHPDVVLISRPSAVSGSGKFRAFIEKYSAANTLAEQIHSRLGNIHSKLYWDELSDQKWNLEVFKI